MDNRRKKKKPNTLALILAFLGLSYAEYATLEPGEMRRDAITAFLIGLGLSALDAGQVTDQVIPVVEVTETWVLGYGGKSGENCPICIGFSNMGPMFLGYFPEQRTHTTYCEEFCTCHMEYSDGQDHPEVQRYTDWQDWELNRGFAM
jgi:hypothetical protein